jgi:hypothetical protein
MRLVFVCTPSTRVENVIGRVKMCDRVLIGGPYSSALQLKKDAFRLS